MDHTITYTLSASVVLVSLSLLSGRYLLAAVLTSGCLSAVGIMLLLAWCPWVLAFGALVLAYWLAGVASRDRRELGRLRVMVLEGLLGPEAGEALEPVQLEFAFDPGHVPSRG